MKEAVLTKDALQLIGNLTPYRQALLVQLAHSFTPQSDRGRFSPSKLLTRQQEREYRTEQRRYRAEFKAKYGRHPRYEMPIAPRIGR